MKEKLPVIAEPTPFELTNAVDGKSFNSEDGKVKVLTFFYSNCPDICPLTLNDYSSSRKSRGVKSYMEVTSNSWL
ncbi:SCO family protein [Exiguobacterium sp. SL14]|nr:SCO family protein [Exiguobacterium sp. SL14]MCY1690524.1 SCO family protein [Exiguobacterium sp. SL14]